MAVNLVRQFGRDSAREILETSFAQFQADRAVVGFVRTVRRNEEALAGYAEAMTVPPRRLRRVRRDPRRDPRRSRRTAPRRRSAVAARRRPAVSLEKLRIGDIMRIPAGRHSGLAVVVMPNRGGTG